MVADGTWSITIYMPIGEPEAVLVLQTNAGRLSGSLSVETEAASDIADGMVDGAQVSWSVGVTEPLQMTLRFKGEIVGDSISGEIASPVGGWRFAGMRINPAALQ